MPADRKLWLHDSPTLPIKHDLNFSSTAKQEWWESAEKKESSFTKKQKPFGYQKDWKTFSHKVFAQWES
jgi:hypothetical protein